MDLKVKNRSNQQNNIRNEFLDPKSLRNHLLYSNVGQTIKKLISKMADGGHFGFEALLELARTF